MNRREWGLSVHYLREILADFRNHGHLNNQRLLQYKFAILYNPMFDMFHLWNGVSRNTMATFKLGDNLLVRYREKSYYKYEIQKLQIDGKKSIFIPSKNLSRHRDWVNGQIGNRVEQQIARVQQDFLDNPLSVRFRLYQTNNPPLEFSTSHLGQFGTLPQGLQSHIITVTVHFSTAEQAQTERQATLEKLRYLEQRGHISRDCRMTIADLNDLYSYYTQRDQYEGPIQSSPGYNPTAATYYGRPVEEIHQELQRMGAQEGVRVSEVMMRQAAANLDYRDVSVEIPTNSISEYANITDNHRLADLYLQEYLRGRETLHNDS